LLVASAWRQSTSFSSAIFQNPNWHEVSDLRNWFVKHGQTMMQAGELNSVSARRQAGRSN